MLSPPCRIIALTGDQRQAPFTERLRYFHAWHHRYTQDPKRDPELMFPRADSRSSYLREISTIGFWYRRAVDYGSLALGTVQLPFMPDNARRAVQVSVAMQWLIYLAAATAMALRHTAPLYFFFLPSVLAMPLMRAYLITEHTLCSRDQNFLTNTRTTLANFPDPPADVEHAVPR